jgi:hypothetical protein
VATIYNPAVDHEKLRALQELAAAIVDTIPPELDAIDVAATRLQNCHLEAGARDEALSILRNGRAIRRVTKYLASISGRQLIQPKLLDVCYVWQELTPLLGKLLGESVALEILCAPVLADQSRSTNI